MNEEMIPAFAGLRRAETPTKIEVCGEANLQEYQANVSGQVVR